MNAALPPSGFLTPTDTVELSQTQRARLIGRIRRRDWALKAAGAALLAVSGGLAWMLILDPAGMVPGLPGFWKGAPIILFAAFSGIYGGLILVLRRFSLASVLVAMLAAALCAFAAQAYVRTIQDSERLLLQFPVAAEKVPAFSASLTQSLTEARLRGLVSDLRGGGILEEPSAFEEVLISIGPGEAGAGVELEARFVFCPFVHARQSPGRYLAMQYATLITDLKAEAATGPEAAKHSDEEVRVICSYLHRRYDERFKTRADAARWLAQREPDAEVKSALERFAEREETSSAK